MLGPKFRRALPWIITSLAVSCFAYIFVDNFVTNLRISFAEEQTSIFEEMRQKSLASDSVGEILGDLTSAARYYPSGTKQIKGSRLDRIVERARQSAIREIIAILRTRTGKDFGADHEAWRKGLSVIENP